MDPDAARFIPGRESPPNRPVRFYTKATIVERGGAFAVMLDGKLTRTPAKNPLSLPTARAGQAVADEWNAQGSVIDPAAMPLTRLANSAIDGVAPHMAATRAETAKYFASDLLLYRAAETQLAARQAEGWNPVLDWARDAFGADFAVTEGVVHVAQPTTTLDAMAQALERAVGHGSAAPFRLAALNVMTTLTGSALLALAVLRGHLTAEEAWSAAHLDEAYQEAFWGADAEALERRSRRWADMAAAARMATLVEPEPPHPA